MSNSKGIEQNNEYGITSYDPSQFAISNGILTKYLGHNSIVEVPNIVEQIHIITNVRRIMLTHQYTAMAKAVLVSLCFAV